MSRFSIRLFAVFGLMFILTGPLPAIAQDNTQANPEQPQTQETPERDEAEPRRQIVREGAMTIERMDEIIRRLSEEVDSPREGTWQFVIEERPVLVVTDARANRMRVMVPVTREDQIKPEDWKRISQANFDTALDARYALARDILWATFIHPLSELHPRQLISGIGQAVNLSITFGTTYSSGGSAFNGGDSNEILRQQLIEELQKKGEEV